jgi:hypothetical protein
MASMASTDPSTEEPRQTKSASPPAASSASLPAAADTSEIADWSSAPWDAVAARIEKHFAKQPLAKIFPEAVSGGGVLRWGLALACGKPVSPLQATLSELGSGCPANKKRLRLIDWELAVEEMLRDIEDSCASSKFDLPTLAEAALWAYALPPLIAVLREPSWKSLCQSLDSLARHCSAITDASSSARLIGGGELALVLRLRLGELASDALANLAVEGLERWSDAGEDSIGASLRDSGRTARLVTASILRQQRLVRLVTKRKVKKRRLGTAIDLACWVAAMTRRDGTAVFSSLTRSDLRDDLVSGGLFDAIKGVAPKLLGPAVDAVLGVGHSGGQLAWQVSLPESLWHSELAGTAAALPEWDVRRGRTYVDYSGEDFRIEIESGRSTALRGVWEVLIDVDGAEQAASGPWMHVCEYSDDDVQYLEFEQRWTGGIRLQRQLMLIREDRCVMLADAVLRDEEQPSAKIGYIGRVPLADEITPEAEAETTEVWLLDGTAKRRGLVMSLQSNEWRTGRTAARFEVTADRHLKLQTNGHSTADNGGGIFAPLWLDFQQRRFDRPRTWRQLTIADDLRLVDPDEAMAHRIQLGSEQWVTYRSLRGERTRTFLGKHLIADFYCARFHPSDGRMEDLLTVGDHDEDIERAAAEADALTE